MTATFISAGAIPSMSITPDILRLIIVLAFVYGAILDYRTRRVYNEFWIPLIGLCFIVLAWDTALLVVPNTIGTTGYLFSMGVSLLVVPSIAFTLWQADILGGADLKALAFLAVFFPEVPEITVSGVTYPVTPGITSMFAITILVNAIILASGYRVFLTVKNLVNADVSRIMTRATKYETSVLSEKHGDIVDCPDGDLPHRFDIDTLRLYLQWRGISIENLTSNADFYRTTDPAVENEIGDGSLASDEKTPLGHSQAEFNPHVIDDPSAIIPITPVSDTSEDPWAAERFTEMTAENDVHVPESPHSIREGLDSITRNDEVWVSPAIPFFIPLTVALVIALTYGSLFVGGTEWVAELIVQVFF